MDPQDAKTPTKRLMPIDFFGAFEKKEFLKIVKKRRKNVDLAHMHFALYRQTAFPDPSLEPPNEVPCSSGPPRALQKPTLELPGPPRTLPRAPKDPRGPPKSSKSTIKKPRKYVYLALNNHKKLIFFNFSTSPVPPGTHLGLHPCHPDPPQGAQKHPRALLGTSLGAPRAPL